ncbi:MAG TPA: hypothetical protein VK211_11960 [Kamptonema sp.]|nr:hypothetical protein [Kamptonema sp.]
MTLAPGITARLAISPLPGDMKVYHCCLRRSLLGQVKCSIPKP